MSVRLVVPMLLRRRGKLLQTIVTQAQKIADAVWFILMLDDPEEEVLENLEAFPAGTRLVRARRRTLDGGDWFFDQRNILHEIIDKECPWVPTHGSLWDDDHALLDVRSTRDLLADPEVDLVYAKKKYLWDDAVHINHAIASHHSVLFWRWLPGDRYPHRRDGTRLHRPDGHPGATRTIPVLDNGYLDPAERLRVFRDFKAAGKIDAMTLSLFEPPILEAFSYEGTDLTPTQMER